MVRGLRGLVVALTIAVVAAPAAAQQALRAAALVNDEVISAMDLQMRVRLVMLSSGMSDSPEQRERLAPQVLRTMIDERLQLQEAARLGIEVQEPEVDQAVARVAQQNNIPAQRFEQMLRQNGVLPQVFRNQVRASIAWQKILAREVRPQVQIGSAEVEAMVERLKSRTGERRLRVREIFLPLNEPEEDAQVRGTARRLIEQLRGGADFASLARQFSQAATASVGGDLGWLTPGSMPDAVAEALASMKPGQVAGPIRTFGGYYIVRLEDTRRISAGAETLHLKQIFLPLPGDADNGVVTETRTRAKELAERVEGCESMGDVAAEAGSADSGDLGEVKLSNLPGNVRQAVAELPESQPSEPIRVNAGIAVLMVCGRETSGIDREQIQENLVRQQIDMRARRYMRDLRRAAHVDVRL